MSYKNIKAQFFHAIDCSFKEGVSKHSYKKEYGNDFGNRIFSYQTRSNLKDTARDFASFMKQNHGEIRFVKDIKKEHVSEFLQSKTSSCSAKTLQQYQTRLDKIGKCCAEIFKKEIDYKVKAPEPVSKNEKVRTLAMDRNDLAKVLETGKKSDSLMAIKLSEAFGLRVSETIKIRPKDIQNDTLHIVKSKGGRDRFLEIRTSHQREVLNELKHFRDVPNNKPILKVKADSVNNYLHRNLERNGISKYAEHKTGLHSIRKMYATERYNELRSTGLNHRKAWDKVSDELGHGKKRDDLFKIYVVK